jgi:tetratricopeptide (TPR) repeat protein
MINGAESATDGATIVAEAIRLVDSGAQISEDKCNQILDLFESYEAWGPYFRLLKRLLTDSKLRRVSDFLRLARAQGLYLEDVNAAAETCRHLVADMKISFSELRDEFLPRIIEAGDFVAEAKILQRVSGVFVTKESNIECLERLCLLFEKKVHNESELTGSYERLLSADPQNMKALRYFKLVFTQSGDWKEVVAILQRIMSSVKRRQELFRAAQELAGVYLYQLDQPDRAIRILDEHCNDSPLDTSTLAFDAYQRQGDADGCLKVLRQCVLNVNDDVSRAILHFKMATLQEQLGQSVDAYENFLKASKLWITFADPVEGALNIALARKDWIAVKQLLADLASRVQDMELVGQLSQAIKRLEHGLEHAGK